jgi:[citrate (pro-3S)-lyase] ligase
VICAEWQNDIVGCGAIAGNVLKCIASTRPTGEGLSLKLLTELLTLAYELNRSELFLFTKPENARCFPAPASGPSRRRARWQYYVKTAANDWPLLSPTGDVPPARKTIGAIVMNANPFTLGHRYLVEQAAASATGCICLW